MTRPGHRGRSSTRYRVADHFKGKDPSVRALFRLYRDLIRGFGPVRVVAQRSRIVFQARDRFAGAAPRKRWLACGLWLKRRVDSARFRKIEFIPPNRYVHSFRVTRPEDLDEVVTALLREAYAVGRQARWTGLGPRSPRR